MSASNPSEHLVKGQNLSLTRLIFVKPQRQDPNDHESPLSSSKCPTPLHIMVIYAYAMLTARRKNGSGCLPIHKRRMI
ncbi:hypothetical protein FA13DRAFT_1731113 [Coprinellus micaceus]|uniref:Uncharacterized protein n=1 Tax=Coprinellus micaceus TaxID=71717 RepID=A0A4Y7TEL8_COPMI|nr:hypothetical protein FA13DRAFT_1731113 [Coprinellus micaceus]